MFGEISPRVAGVGNGLSGSKAQASSVATYANGSLIQATANVNFVNTTTIIVTATPNGNLQSNIALSVNTSVLSNPQINAASNTVATYANGNLILAAANLNFNNSATVNVSITANGTNQTNIAFSTNPISNVNVAYSGASNYYLAGVPTIGSGSAPVANAAVYVVAANNQLVAADFSATSDATLKDVTGSIKDPLTKIQYLTGVEFLWNTKAASLGLSNPSPQVGVLAQDVLNAVPEAVDVGDNGILRVSYDKLIPLLIEAVKELSAKVAILEAR